METEGIDGTLYEKEEYIDVVYPSLKEKARELVAQITNSGFLTNICIDDFDYGELLLFKTNQSSLQLGDATEDFEVW